jgi:hypothetical protein
MWWRTFLSILRILSKQTRINAGRKYFFWKGFVAKGQTNKKGLLWIKEEPSLEARSGVTNDMRSSNEQAYHKEDQHSREPKCRTG